MKKYAFFLVLALIASVAIAEEQKTITFTAKPDPDGVQRVSISAGDFFFDPNHIIVKLNVPVELSVRKVSGVAPHDLVMESPEAGMKFDVSYGKEPATAKFTPSKPGKYPFFCSKKFAFFKSHRDRGMQGVIEVVE